MFIAPSHMGESIPPINQRAGGKSPIFALTFRGCAPAGAFRQSRTVEVED
jgi:hypothetical protein